MASVLHRQLPTMAGSEYWNGRWEKDPREATGTQSLMIPISTDGTIFPLENLISYTDRREMLRHPVIAMARQLAIAPMVLTKWTVKMNDFAPPTAKMLVEQEIVGRKHEILERALKDCFDFGFQANEIVWNPDGKSPVGDDAITIKKFKPLYPYITFLRANPLDGSFAGVRQFDARDGGLRYLDSCDVQLFNIDQEGSNLYGNSMLDNAVQPFRDWKNIRNTSLCYLNKIAGAHWVVYYPDGMTKYNGADMPNQAIANELLNKVEANSGIALPSDVNDFIFDQNSKSQRRQWEIQTLTDSGSSSASYVEQLRHFQELMVMGMMFPPRALLEGQYGTKAEAVVHSEAPVASMEMISCRLAKQMSDQVVNQLLELNYGENARDTVWLEVAPITNDNRIFLQSVYTQLLANPETAYAIFDNEKMEDLSKKLGI